MCLFKRVSGSRTNDNILNNRAERTSALSQHERRSAYQGNANLISRNLEGKQKKRPKYFPSFCVCLSLVWGPGRRLATRLFFLSRLHVNSTSVVRQKAHGVLMSSNSCGAKQKHSLLMFFLF